MSTLTTTKFAASIPYEREPIQFWTTWFGFGLAVLFWPITLAWLLVDTYLSSGSEGVAYMIGGDQKMYGDPQIVGYPNARRDIQIRAIRQAQEEESRRRDG